MSYRELEGYRASLPERALNSDIQELEAAALAARRRCRIVDRLHLWLQRLATLGTALGLLGSVFFLFVPGPFLAGFSFLLSLLLGSVLVKILGVPVELEMPGLQATVLFITTGFFLLVTFSAGLFWVVLGSALLSGLFMVLTTITRRIWKLRALAWMLASDDFRSRLAGHPEFQTARERHRALAIQRFDDPNYIRAFSVKRSRNRARVTALDEVGEKPVKKEVRVRVWKRDPTVDLSAIREFGVCCFLGGSQDASAFDFLVSPTITMVDVSKGPHRRLRALCMACVMKEEGREVPVFVVNALFGRESGLVGSHRKDDAFCRAQLEAVARYAGFDRILYHADPTNTRPRLFAETTREAWGPPERVRCRLSVPTDVKLEIFNRRRPFGNVYLTLFLEVFGWTGPRADRGTISGHLVPLEDELGPLRGAEPERSGEERTELRPAADGPALDLPESLSRDPGRPILEGFWRGLAGFWGRPEPIAVGWADGERTGLIIGGRRMALHPVLQNGGPLLGAVAIGRRLLYIHHPDPTRERWLELLDGTSFDWREAILNDLADLPGPETDDPRAPLLHPLVREAVRSRYDLHPVFTDRELYAFVREKGLTIGDRDLARAFLEEKVETYAGFRERYLADLEGERRATVLEWLVDQATGWIASLRCVDRTPETFGLDRYPEIEERIRSFRKRAARGDLELSEETEARIETILERCHLLGQLDEIERAIQNGNEGHAKQALATLREKQEESLGTQNLMPLWHKLRKKARYAPIQRLIDRWNLF